MHISPAIFRKYDIRGTYPEELNPEIVNAIVARLGFWWNSHRAKSKLIILGHDARISSDLFYRVAWRTLKTYPNLKVLPVGLITTPMLYYLVSSRRAVGGLLITASHSPVNYNGMKVVGEAAVNVSGVQMGKWLEQYKLPERHRIFAWDNPVPKPLENYYSDYANFLSRIPKKINQPLKIVLDCSNSPAGLVAAKIHTPNLKISLLNTKPDGSFPAHGPNPLRPGALDQLKRAVKKQRADFGVAVDGDADRAVFVDDCGCPVHPDVAAYLLMRDFRPPFVMDARTGWLVRNSLQKIFLSQVGHTNVKKVIRAHRANFGAETSGHFFFKNQFGRTLAYNDSALQAIMHLVHILSKIKARHQSLSDVLSSLPRSARGEVNFEVKKWLPIKSRLERAYPKRYFSITHLDGLTVEDKKSPPDFWFNIRPSNTEPILRLSVEAREKNILESELIKLTKIIRPVKSERQGVM